jgi:inositol-phosphate phosphatase/L-galactose 1-phosphate phosphatase/histidinol-phosphatase
MQDFIAFANRLADEAGTIARAHFRTPFEVISKGDDSPVTIADRAIEKRMREIIESERPEDGILGEEFGVKESRNGFTWVLDPIDGTKSFVIGRPTFGTLIALCEKDIPVLGVIDQPIARERWVGAKGTPTLFNGKAVKTRPCKNLKDACASSTTPAMFAKTGPVYERFDSACHSKEWGSGAKMLAWGGDCYMYGLLASGFMDLCFEASLSPYDFCALVPVVEGAGGMMCDWNGNKLTIKSDGKVIALGDASLKDQVLKLLA